MADPPLCLMILLLNLMKHALLRQTGLSIIPMLRTDLAENAETSWRSCFDYMTEFQQKRDLSSSNPNG